MATGMHYGATKEIFQYAEVLRKKMTEAEKIIWEKLCKNQPGVRIRKQHPVWKFIAVFYCHELKLIIEIDGGIHLRKETREYDISRDIIIKDFGIEVMRFTNEQAINETDWVVGEIKSKIELLKQKQIQKLNPNSTAG
jgi:very-short-patch-repair endonuclease